MKDTLVIAGAYSEHTARNYASLAAAAGVELILFVYPSFSQTALLALEYEVAILVNVSGSLEPATRETKTPVSAFMTPQNPHLINKKSGNACSKEQGNNVARGSHTQSILKRHIPKSADNPVSKEHWAANGSG